MLYCNIVIIREEKSRPGRAVHMLYCNIVIIRKEKSRPGRAVHMLYCNIVIIRKEKSPPGRACSHAILQHRNNKEGEESSSPSGFTCYTATS